MTQRAVAAAAAVTVVWLSMTGSGAEPRLQEAHLAWDRGDYPTALKLYIAALNAPGADDERSFDEIALQTGELFQTIELTPDGGSPRFAPDGRFLTYEIGRGIARRTRLVATESPATVLAELPGHGASFSPDSSRLVYLSLTPTAEMLDLERQAARAVAPARNQILARLAALTGSAAAITLRDVASGAERTIETGGRRKTAVRLGAGGVVLFNGSEGDGPDQIFVVSSAGTAAPVTTGEPDKVLREVNPPGTAAFFTHRPQSGRGGRGSPPAFGVISLPRGEVTTLTGSAPAFSADGSAIAYVNRTADRSELLVAATADPARSTAIRSGPERLDAPAFSHDGSRIVFQIMPAHDWELHAVGRDGAGEQRLTREIQHDLAPQFLTGHQVLGLVGEARHRRSYLHDLRDGTRVRLFHNNTIRTIAPEYEWVPAPDGTKLLVVAERDGNTVSPDRGVYLMDLTKKVSRDELRARIEGSLAAEEALRAKGVRLFAPIAETVRRVVGDASVARVFGYEKALYDFDSKHISRPGNRLASQYLFETYKSFGYEPEYQWFAGRGALGGQTANVLATLKGTLHPELVYVVSSHYDSVAAGPGADDDSSGTAALLETARLLSRHPQPATIVFASFTAEESGLLGSREFVRRAVADDVKIVGALNNDMIGWANDHRLDNTIRYSNPGIRDIQHAAAMQFSGLITYDALYYKNTDAHAYYEAYGDIVGGIGSYPVLGNPHYHQPHDTLETINHQLVTEVARTTTATLMLLASSPSRVKGLRLERSPDGAVALAWAASPERDVTGYVVAWREHDQGVSQELRVVKPAATVKARPGAIVTVKAVNRRGLESWDEATAIVK